jgi:DNA-binding NarL/FixJ family response regulator
MRAAGDWTGALAEVQRACARLLEPPPHPAVADAFYQVGELHRLRGEFAEAEAAYVATSEWGREPQPGIAQLRLAQGQAGTAAASLRRVMAETHDRLERARLLAAFVDIALAVQDGAAARSAADELAEIASDIGAPFLELTAAHALGTVALADGNAHEAISALRRAVTTCAALDVPYEAARARSLIGAACCELDDDDTASMELETARRMFADLGAAPDMARVDALLRTRKHESPSGLTGREIEVLGLIVSGQTNREIGNALYISEKTVARHVSNIFAKLGVSSRAAATAYALRHRLV